MSQPPSTQSIAETRTPTGIEAGQRCAHRIEHLERKAHALGQRATVRIGAPIGDRRQELVQQVAVRRMQLDGIEPEPLRAQCGVHEGPAHARKPRVVERRGGGRLRRAATPTAPPAASRPARGAINAPPRHGTSLDPLRPAWASWIEIGTGIAPHAGQHVRQRALAAVGVQAQATRRDAPDRLDRRRLDDQQPGAGDRQLARDGSDASRWPARRRPSTGTSARRRCDWPASATPA